MCTPNIFVMFVFLQTLMNARQEQPNVLRMQNVLILSVDTTADARRAMRDIAMTVWVHKN